MAVFTIESETKSTVSKLKNLFEFLEDFKNFHSILPPDKVEDFQASGNECSFNIKGITPMKVKLVEKVPHSTLLYVSDGLSKFNFKLKVSLMGESLEKGMCKIELTSDLNPFIKVMAEKPLTQLVNAMSLKLSELVTV